LQDAHSPIGRVLAQHQAEAAPGALPACVGRFVDDVAQSWRRSWLEILLMTSRAFIGTFPRLHYGSVRGARFRPQIGGGGFVDQLMDDNLALGDLAPFSVDRDEGRLVQRIGQQRLQLLFAAAAGVAGLPLAETGVQRRAAEAHMWRAPISRGRCSVAQRSGRDRGRAEPCSPAPFGGAGAAAVGRVWRCSRSCARCRACRSAGLIGSVPIRCRGMLSLRLSIPVKPGDDCHVSNRLKPPPRGADRPRR
jgi:hypothetical protein